jgi:hypothetical protein
MIKKTNMFNTTAVYKIQYNSIHNNENFSPNCAVESNHNLNGLEATTEHSVKKLISSPGFKICVPIME